MSTTNPVAKFIKKHGAHTRLHLVMPGHEKSKRGIHVAIWLALLALAMSQLFIFLDIGILSQRTHQLGLIAAGDGIAPVVEQSSITGIAGASDDLVPPLAGCTPEDRKITTFICPSTPTHWITGTAPMLGCFKGKAPNCGAGHVFSCNAGACVTSPAK